MRNFIKSYGAVICVLVCCSMILAPITISNYNEAVKDQQTEDIWQNALEMQRTELKRALCLEYYALKIEGRDLGDTTETPDDVYMENNCSLLGLPPNMFNDKKDLGSPT